MVVEPAVAGLAELEASESSPQPPLRAVQTCPQSVLPVLEVPVAVLVWELAQLVAVLGRLMPGRLVLASRICFSCS